MMKTSPSEQFSMAVVDDLVIPYLDGTYQRAG
jgi:hypothetical protein